MMLGLQDFLGYDTKDKEKITKKKNKGWWSGSGGRAHSTPVLPKKK
jgi:hypothetical protein